MPAKIPPEAFNYYLGLGVGRSYDAVAREYGVTKRGVHKHAAKNDWQRRVDEIELKAREAMEKRAVESIDQMNERHLRSLRIVQAKALEALKNFTLANAMDAIRALDVAIKHERVIRGEPGERNAISLEDVVKREYSTWLKQKPAEAPQIPIPTSPDHPAKGESDGAADLDRAG